MKNSICYFVLAAFLFFIEKIAAQQLIPFAGGTTSDGNVHVNWAMGEIVTITIDQTNGVATQGLLQPLIDISDDTTTTYKTVNAITPNSDGINDVLTIEEALQLPNNQLIIINRWGQIVFRSAGAYRNNWSGTDQKGNPLPMGVYRVLFFNHNKDKKPSLIDNIHIIR